MTLYLKYRPKNLDELDLPEVGTSLKKLVLSGDIPHALLFAGPKGTGKTSAARILAKIINCENLKNGEPCDDCTQCVSTASGNNLDVFEMDAASHRGIDDIRTLRDGVKLSPSKAKKKIYIIDEAHMLTTEASNALLKTLEEPPEHVVFILATTNPEKLLDTIRSRTTYINFKKAGTAEIVKALRRVTVGEKIKIEDNALEVIAEASGGAFRDAIKTFEQIISEGRDLTKESLEEYLFSKKAFDLENFIAMLLKKDVANLVKEVGQLSTKGASVDGFLSALLGNLRNLLLIKVGVQEGKDIEIGKDDLIFLIDLLVDASKSLNLSPIEELPLEVAIIKWCGEKTPSNSDKPQKVEVKDEPNIKINIDTPVVSVISNIPEVNAVDIASGVVTPEALKDVLEVNGEAWKNILSLVKPINASVEALLRAARPISYDGKVLVLGVYYKFHKERLEDIHHRKVLEEIVAKVLNSPTKVVCTLTEPQPKKIIEEAKIEPVLTEGQDRDIMKVAEEIFGN